MLDLLWFMMISTEIGKRLWKHNYECNWSIAKTLAVCTQYFLAWCLNNQLEISTFTLVLCYDKPYYEICFSYVLESNK